MEEINLIEVLNYFKSKIVAILSITIIVMILGNVYNIITEKPMFQSNTTILLANKNSQNFNELQFNKNLISTYSEVIKSRKVLNQVIKVLDLDYSVQQLSNNITVSSVEDTEIIKISVSDENSERSALIANQIAETFSKEIKEYYNLENIAIVDKAVEPLTPYNINHVKDNLLLFIIGIVLSSVVVFIIYYFDTTIKSGDELENKYGLTILGNVPIEKERS